MKAAKAEVRVSQINVALCLQRGVPHGVPNLEEAFFWFQESTKPLRHEEEKSDLQKTQKLFVSRLAADYISPVADGGLFHFGTMPLCLKGQSEYLRGLCLWSGKGCVKDKRKAISSFKTAAAEFRYSKAIDKLEELALQSLSKDL